jgi:4-diphosphocytidyl-2-C-methyl-D-erythritol kinase
VQPFPLPAPVYAVLVNPMRHVPTPDVFKALARKDHAPMAPVPNGAAAFWDWLAEQRNDLQAPAIALQPDIAKVLDALNHDQARVVRMSGSGSTCFALFDRQGPNVAAARDIQANHPDWWVAPVRLS